MAALIEDLENLDPAVAAWREARDALISDAIAALPSQTDLAYT
jgi:hypothetical protein